MAERQDASRASLSNRSARRVLASGLALLCASVWAVARAEEPRVLRALPPVTDTAPQPYPSPYAQPMPQPAAYQQPAFQTPVVQQAGFQQAAASAMSPPAAQLPTVMEEEQPTFLYGFETIDPNDPFVIKPAGYASAYPGTGGGVPSVAMRTSKSILNLQGLQDPQAPKPPPEVDSSEGGGGGDGASGEDGEGGEKKEEQTYGQAPTNNSLQFLRQVDVLLKPGAWQMDTGFVYTLFTNDFPLPLFNGLGEIDNVVEAQVARRLLWTPFAVRYGLRKNIQLFAVLPMGFSNTQLSTLGVSETRNVSGIGDLTAGASFHLIKGEGHLPDLIGTLGFTAPTGKFDTPLFGLVPGSNLGQGFWALAGQGLFIHRYDPVIVYYGGGYRHLWGRPFDGVQFQPGEQANYMFGCGFSVNDRVTLASTFQGYYITNTFINDVNVRGSNLEPLSLRFSITTVCDCKIIEPFVQFGLTDAAPRANVGVIVTFY